MTKLKFMSAGLIAAAMLATPAMAQEGRVMSRHFAATADAGTTPPGAFYIDGRACIPAPRVGAYATQPWHKPPCEPSQGY